MSALLERTDDGLHCPDGGFHVDPWRPVERAIVTHAHGDHACPGSRSYLTAEPGEALLRARLGPEAIVETIGYGEALRFDGLSVSLHPSGHILGSAQVRIERGGEVWVVSGDYKLEPDATCPPFEPLACHTFVTESTFGLPIYRWPKESAVFADINAWWRANREASRASVLFVYAVGKAQRVLAGVDASIGPIVAHGAIERVNGIYRDRGIPLPPTTLSGGKSPLVLAPAFTNNSPWLRRFAPYSTGMASGWMRIRGTRRRRALDRGFVLSDHADWPALLRAIDATGAECIWVTHGYRGALARWIEEHGKRAEVVETPFEGELIGETEEA